MAFEALNGKTDIKYLPDMVLDEDGGSSRLYRRNGDTLNIDAAAIESCSYIFYQGRFYGVFIEFTSLLNANAIKETLLQQHGEGTITYFYKPIDQERETKKRQEMILLISKGK